MVREISCRDWAASALRVASDAGEDLVGGFGPKERLGGFVVGGDEFADGGLQFADTAVNPAADLLVGEFGKPPLDQVDPGPVGGRVVDMEAWTLRKPPPDEGRLVGPIVVHDDVDNYGDRKSTRLNSSH